MTKLCKQRYVKIRFYKYICIFNRTKNPKFAHLTDEDAQKVEQTVNQSYQWLEQTRVKLQSTPKHLPPPITVAQIRQERNSFESTVQPILKKPPPKAPSPPKDEKNSGDKAAEQSSEEEQQQPQNQEQTPQNEQENMEWSST